MNLKDSDEVSSRSLCQPPGNKLLLLLRVCSLIHPSAERKKLSQEPKQNRDMPGAHNPVTPGISTSLLTVSSALPSTVSMWNHWVWVCWGGKLGPAPSDLSVGSGTKPSSPKISFYNCSWIYLSGLMSVCPKDWKCHHGKDFICIF